VYSKEEVDAIKETHVQPSSFQDKLALFAVKTVRFGFDVGSGYAIGTLTKEKVLRRLIFLETVAGWAL
jgi:hypothetical protein